MGLLLAFAAATGLAAAGLLDAPALVAITLSSTGMGLVIPILRNADLLNTTSGATVVGMASVAEFAAVLLLAAIFSTGGRRAVSVVLLLGLALLAVTVTVLGRRVASLRRVSSILNALSGGTVQLRVRLSVASVVCFAALAQKRGPERLGPPLAELGERLRQGQARARTADARLSTASGHTSASSRRRRRTRPARRRSGRTPPLPRRRRRTAESVTRPAPPRRPVRRPATTTAAPAA